MRQSHNTKVDSEPIRQLTIDFENKQKDRLQSTWEIKDYLLDCLQQELAIRSTSLLYDYWADYTKRLSADNSLLQDILTKKVLTWKVWKYYNLLIQNIGTSQDKELFSDTLYKNLLEDIVYEHMDKTDIENNHTSHLDLSDWRFMRKYYKDQDGLLNILQWIKSIDLTRHWILWREELDLIFNNISWIKIVHLWNNNLWKRWKTTLKMIFKHLQWVKGIDLRWNQLWLLSKEKLTTIFKHLQWVRSIDLRINGLWALWKEELATIFKYLQSAKYINLKWNEILPETQNMIQSRLPNTILVFA